jgi:hypothetical protein
MAFLLHFQIYAWYHMVKGCSTAFFCDSRLHALSRVYHVQQAFFLTTKQATSIRKTTTVTSTPKLTSQLEANPYAAPQILAHELLTQIRCIDVMPQRWHPGIMARKQPAPKFSQRQPGERDGACND